MRTAIIDVDVMLGDSYYGRVKTILPLNPVMNSDGSAQWVVSEDDIKREIERKYPTLKGKDYKVYDNINVHPQEHH